MPFALLQRKRLYWYVCDEDLLSLVNCLDGLHFHVTCQLRLRDHHLRIVGTAMVEPAVRWRERLIGNANFGDHAIGLDAIPVQS